MSKEKILGRVEEAIAQANLGLARERLLSLLHEYPDDLTIRRQLGDVYSQLQQPERAGCFWFLEEDKTPAMQEACSYFQKSSGHQPELILRRLKFHHGPNALPEGFAKKKLVELRKAASRYRFPGEKQRSNPPRLTSTKNTLISFGCLLLAIAFLAIFMTGIWAISSLARGYEMRHP